jgi:hypothetical protein
MKTLDEVIKSFEWCIDDGHDDCDGCPYNTGEVTDCHERNIDALHYLRELRDMTDIPMEYFENGGTSQKLRNTSQITCPKCHSEFVILDDPDGDHAQLLKCQALLQDIYRNDPLTWNELRTMEGKPVWLERPEWKEWLLISEIDEGKCEIYLRDKWGNGVIVNGRNVGYWRAYRKERDAR